MSIPRVAANAEAPSYSFWVAVSFTINYIIGSGFLTLPWAFEQTGVLLGLLVLVIFAYFSQLAVLFLLETTEHAHTVLNSGRQVRTESGVDYLSLTERVPADYASAVTSEYNDGEITFMEIGENDGNGDARAHSEGGTGSSQTLARRLEITELCSIFLGQRGKRIYTAFVVVYLYGTCWAYGTVFANAFAAHMPFTADPEHSYVPYLLVFAAFVVPLSLMELSEQVYVQVTLTDFRVLMVTCMVLTVVVSYANSFSVQDSFPGNQARSSATTILGGSYSIYYFFFHKSKIISSGSKSSVVGVQKVFHRLAGLIQTTLRSSSAGNHMDEASTGAVTVFSNPRFLLQADGAEQSSILRFRPDQLYKLLPIAAYAFIFQHSVPALAHPVRDKSQLPQIFGLAIIISLVSYIAVASCLALFFGKDIQNSSNLNWTNYGLNSLPSTVHARSDDVDSDVNGDNGSGEGQVGELDDDAVDGVPGLALFYFERILSYFIVLFPALDVASAFPLNAFSLGNNMMSAWYGPAMHRCENSVSHARIFRLLAAVPPIFAASFVRDLGKVTSFTGLTGFAVAFLFPALLDKYSIMTLDSMGLSSWSRLSSCHTETFMQNLLMATSVILIVTVGFCMLLLE